MTELPILTARSKAVNFSGVTGPLSGSPSPDVKQSPERGARTARLGAAAGGRGGNAPLQVAGMGH